jgi:hypothetical protein
MKYDHGTVSLLLWILLPKDRGKISSGTGTVDDRFSQIQVEFVSTCDKILARVGAIAAASC